MTEKRGKIILCKGVSRENETQKSYQSVLENAGFQCDILPTLRFDFVNLDVLEDCLLNVHQYSGLICTSQRSIEVMDLIQKQNSDCLKNWKSLPCYCVGPATASLAQERLSFTNILGSESGNAENLAHFIIKNCTSDMLPLLYPCSEIARETIDRILTEKGIKINKIIVYQTLPSKTLEADFNRLVDSSVKCLVFFSPSTVEYIVPLLERKKHLYENIKIKIVAIGQVTNEALQKLRVTVDAVSSKPEPLALLNSIESCI